MEVGKYTQETYQEMR